MKPAVEPRRPGGDVLEMAQAGKKLVPLEGLRGIAAAVVVLYHLVLGFTPKGVGTVPHGHGPFDVVIQFILGLLNGGAAVAVFFVLSGFILSLPFARDRAMARQHAAKVIGAGWMASHGNAPIAVHRLSLWDALKEGLVSVFTTGDVHFDSPLWTMRIELFGSLMIFLAAPLLFELQSWPMRLTLTGAAMCVAGTAYPMTYFSDFLVGALLAMLYAEQRLPVVGNWQALGLGVLAVYLFGFTYEQKLLIDAPLKAVMPAGDTSHFVWDAGAALMILLLLGNPFLKRLFSGRWAVWLGLLSFPIYLLHGPVMLSAGAAAFLSGLEQFGVAGSAVAAALISIALTLLCALPLVWVDKAWTAALGRGANILVRRQPVTVRAERR
jgi:peptidoglycan/LPS O-acetylase OafA/YrhL